MSSGNFDSHSTIPHHLKRLTKSTCGSRILHPHIAENGNPEVVAVEGGLLEGLHWSKA
jgi:hypothetical protein